MEHVNFKGDEEPEVGLCKNLEPDTSDKQVNWSSMDMASLHPNYLSYVLYWRIMKFNSSRGGETMKGFKSKVKVKDKHSQKQIGS